MSIHPLIPMIEFFKIWPSKSKVKVIAQGHITGMTSYRLISLSFHVDRPFCSWDTAISKIDLEDPRSRSWVRSKFNVTMSLASYRLTPLVPCQLIVPFLRYSIFKIWPWKSKVKVIAQGHNMGPRFSRLTSLSFHVNQASHSWVRTFSRFDLENRGPRSWVRSKSPVKVTMWV